MQPSTNAAPSRVVKRYEPSSSTWRQLPKIGGSRWGFVGLIAGIALVVLIALIIAICCCVKRSRNKKRLRRAAVGGDLGTYHPPPTFGRNASAAHRAQFAPVRGDDYDNDAFASSPRNSMSYGESATHKRGPSDYEDGMAMNEMNNRYYRGSEGFRQNYTHPNAGQSEGYGSSYGGYDYGYGGGGGGQERFAEPQYDPSYGGYGQDQSQYSANYGGMPSHASQLSYDQYGNAYNAPPSRSHSAAPSHMHAASGSYHQGVTPQGEHYPTSYESNAGESVPPAYIDYSHHPQHTMSPPPKGRIPGADI
jgi:hypothetical protein